MADSARSSAMPSAAKTGAAPAGRREDVLRALRSAAAPCTIASLATLLHLHPNTVRFHLDSLVRAGRVRRADARPRRPGRPALTYEAIEGMDPGGPRGYRTLAEILTIGLAALPDAESRAMDAGRRWGRQRAAASTGGPALDRLHALLGELGFAPERRSSEGASSIGLRHCPFLELADSHRQIVCPVHLGIMQGAMQEWDGGQTVTRLDPFVEPDLCVAHLSTAR